MRISRLVHTAIVASIIGSGAIWAADVPSPDTDLPQVSARQAMGMTIDQLNVDGVALSRVIDYLRQASGANIVVDWKVLEGVGISKTTPVSLQVRQLTLRKMLQLVLDQVSPTTQLTFSTDSNVIEVTTQDEADKVLVTKVYIVDDLVMTDNNVSKPPTFNLADITSSGTTTGGSGGGGSTASGNSSLFNQSTTTDQPSETSDKKGADLAQLVRDVVRPSIWKENGGNCSIRYFSGKLIVTAPASVQEAIGGPMAPEGGQRFGM